MSPESPITNHQSPRRDAPPRIALVAGEASGDGLGSGLIAALRKRFPEAEFAGIGGASMRDAGMNCWHDCSELAVMGLTEVLRHLPRLLRLRRALIGRLLAWQPDVFIGIDAPDFNLGLERRLKSAGVPTVHYVSPSVWAWREKRAAKIGQSADRVLCLFPIEPPIYAMHGVDARFVGHPMADRFPVQPDRDAVRSALGVSGSPLLAVLPGSRLGELRRLLPRFLDAATRLRDALPGLRLLIPAANLKCRELIDAALFDHAQDDITEVFDGRASEILMAADATLLASGTAALEALLAKQPMVVGYRISGLTYAIVRAFGMMRVERFSLPNALAGHELVAERMQANCTGENLATALLPLLSDPTGALDSVLPEYQRIHTELRRDASANAADAVAELLHARGKVVA
ncbi:MAG: lipid-A-disaccharide synthase [Xanthomonadales bacterium]|nr:lipid-A-disaccharide synthase [Xanthomonadales bacterium]